MVTLLLQIWLLYFSALVHDGGTELYCDAMCSLCSEPGMAETLLAVFASHGLTDGNNLYQHPLHPFHFSCCSQHIP